MRRIGTAGPSGGSAVGSAGGRADRVFQSRAPYWWATTSRASLWLRVTPRAARSARSRRAMDLGSVMTLLLSGGQPHCGIRGLHCLAGPPGEGALRTGGRSWAFTVPVSGCRRPAALAASRVDRREPAVEESVNVRATRPRRRRSGASVRQTSAMRPQVVAHRGASFDNPEHTLGAYVQAIRDG